MSSSELIAEAKTAFFRALDSKGVTLRTRTNYCEAIDQFFGFVLSTRPLLALTEVRTPDIEDYLAHLRHLNRKDSTVANRYRSLRNFFGYCKRAHFVKINPVKGVTHPMVVPNVVCPYTEDEIARLMEATRRWPALALRDQAIIALLYNTGMRAGELVTLQPERVREGALLVYGKGKKERWLALEPTTERLLMTWMTTREEQRCVFNLSVTGLFQTIKRLAHAATPPVAGAYVHRFRDTFAVKFLEAGGHPDDLQIILGHADIQTTMRYIAWGRQQRALDAQRRLAPFARLHAAV